MSRENGTGEGMTDEIDLRGYLMRGAFLDSVSGKECEITNVYWEGTVTYADLRFGDGHVESLEMNGLLSRLHLIGTGL